MRHDTPNSWISYSTDARKHLRDRPDRHRFHGWQHRDGRSERDHDHDPVGQHRDAKQFHQQFDNGHEHRSRQRRRRRQQRAEPIRQQLYQPIPQRIDIDSSAGFGRRAIIAGSQLPETKPRLHAGVVCIDRQIRRPLCVLTAHPLRDTNHGSGTAGRIRIR